MKPFLERDLEDIICTSDRDKLREKGLNINGKIYRQLNIGNYGTADIVTVKRMSHPISSYLDITIYELKLKDITISAFLQSIRYARGIQRYLSERDIGFVINIILIGNNIEKSGDLCYLPSLINNNDYCDINNSLYNINFLTYKYNIDGIVFYECSEYQLKKEGFKNG